MAKTRAILRITILCIFFYAGKAQEDGIYPHDLLFSFEIEKALSNNEIHNEKAAWLYSFIGQYESALQVAGHSIDWQMNDKLIQLDYGQLTSVPAINYISNEADKHSIVMINEAHYKPQHRILTKELLKPLYDKGYRYLAVEALANFNVIPDNVYNDCIISERGYPLMIRNSGSSYIQEPQMGNMIREALNLGYHVFGYENRKQNIPRDSSAALEIIKTIDGFNKGKLLVHCGFSHVIERAIPIKDGFWLGYYLKNLSKTDPLTIHQDIYSEEISGEIYPGYEKLSSEIPSIFLNQAGDPARFFRGLDHFDLIVYDPPTKYVNNRPNWMYKPNSKVVYIQTPINHYPVIIKARLIEDEPLATPIDMIEFKDSHDIKPLILPKGRYQIELNWPDKKEFEEIYVD